ncbi:DUF5994 family protein [Nocardia sp. NBC_01730]|uniref:DUF5994 family protein n=1 Tax=Nocardia sp. NBC_01730 TaxID=2975998 RepID=UPI002E0D4303|nr:DUF5994 family protein [Nocardia sp. NBC_01730]
MKQSKARAGIRSHGDLAPRVQLKPPTSKTGYTTPKTGYVDGAWWPHSDVLVRELPALLAVLAARIGPVHHVAYPLGEWAGTPSELVVAGRTVRCAGYRYGTAHTVEMLGVKDCRLVLLVVPPYTDAHDAFAMMTSASATNDESAVDELLMIGVRERSDRAERAAAEQRWVSEGGAEH